MEEPEDFYSLPSAIRTLDGAGVDHASNNTIFAVTLDGVDISAVNDSDLLRLFIAPINFFMVMVSAIGLAYLYRLIHKNCMNKVDVTRPRLCNVMWKHAAKVMIFLLFEFLDVCFSSLSWCIYKNIHWPSKIIQQIPGVAFHLGVLASISVPLYFIWRHSSLKIVDASWIFVLLASASIYVQHSVKARIQSDIEAGAGGDIESDALWLWYKKLWFPMLAWFAAEFITLLFTMQVAKIFEDGDVRDPLFARNIYQDMHQKPFIRIFITFITQHSLFIFYKGTLDIFSGHIVGDPLVLKYYIVAVFAIMAFILRNDPMAAIIESTRFWGTLFFQKRQQGNLKIIEILELFLRFFADAYCNVFTATTILLIIPYQASIAAYKAIKDESTLDDTALKTSALDFVLNLVAIIYIIALDDLPSKENLDGVFQLNGHEENQDLLGDDENQVKTVNNSNSIPTIRRSRKDTYPTDDDEHFSDEKGLEYFEA